MIHRVLILGGGSAGFLAGLTLRRRLPPGVAVTAVRSKDIGIIGVGEGTTVSVPNFLHGYLEIDPMDFHRAVRPTYKLGIKFRWGPRPHFHYTFSDQFNLHYKSLPRPNGYYCGGDDEDLAKDASINAALMERDKAFVRLADGSPGIRNDVAYHMENAEFVAFLETRAAAAGLEVVEDTVRDVRVEDGRVRGLVCESGMTREADLYVDCSGFVSRLLGKALGEPFVSFASSLFCDRAVVGGWDRGPDEPIKPYTTAETMDAGWCWQIEHEHRVNRGYVYASAFIDDDRARDEFLSKNPKVRQTRVVKYVSGRYRRAWAGNVVAVGNAHGFVEPLESTALFAICDAAQNLAESLADCGMRPGPAMAAVYNTRAARTWDDIRRFLAIHYKFNTRLDTPFWRACRADADVADAAGFIDYYAENGPSPIWREQLIGGRDVFGFEGYLAMMVGQRVPYRRTHTPSDAEWRTWADIRAANARLAADGLTARQTLDVIHSPHWQPRANFYKARQ